MSNANTVEATSTGFGAAEFRAAAKLYAEHKRVVDAIATGIAKTKGGYDNFDDAIAQLTEVWEALSDMKVHGGLYTPDRSQGFGPYNASQIASTLTGDRASVADIRKAFANMGK